MARGLVVHVEFRGDGSKLRREVERSQKGVEKLFGFLKRAPVAAIAGITGLALAFRKVSSALGGAVDAAREQELAVSRLDKALAGLGPTATRVSQALQDQAAALERTTRFGDEAIIQAQALLATLGVQADQLPQATQATVDLADAFDIDLQSAARNVGRTVGGFAGELGELVPELRRLSSEALEAGAGIQVLNEKFRGTADIDTYDERIATLGNAFGTLKESIGASVTEAPDVNKALESITADAKRASEAVKGFGINLVVAFGARAVAGITFLATKAAEGFNRMALDARSVAEELGLVGPAAQEAATGVENLVAAETRLQRIQREIDDSASSFEAGLKRLGVTLDTEINQKIRANNELLEAAALRYNTSGEALQQYERIAVEVARANQELFESLSTPAALTEELGGNFRALRAEMDGTNDTVEALTGSLDENTRATRDSGRAAQNATNGQRALQGALQTTEQRYRATTEAALTFNAVTGATARSTGAQAEVDAALAAGQRPFLGGTRIRLPGGGSRLLGD